MKHQGLGKMQKSNRSNTDWKVFEYLDWCKRNKHKVWFTEIKKTLKMDSSVLRKSLNRLLQQGEIKQYGLVLEKKDKLGRNHSIFYKGYGIRETHTNIIP